MIRHIVVISVVIYCYLLECGLNFGAVYMEKRAELRAVYYIHTESDVVVEPVGTIAAVEGHARYTKNIVFCGFFFVSARFPTTIIITPTS